MIRFIIKKDDEQHQIKTKFDSELFMQIYKARAENGVEVQHMLEEDLVTFIGIEIVEALKAKGWIKV